MTDSLPFLTQIDERAEVKGSRDPLGVVAVWSHFGRKVVGNLSTVATNPRDYTLRVFGQWLVEQIVAEQPECEPVPAFLRFEQLCNYARCRFHPKPVFRGKARAESRLAASRRVKLSAEPAHQLLSNQRVYGVWGLYSVPSGNSGWLAADHALADAGRELVETTCLPFLERRRIDPARDLVPLLARREVTIDLDGRDQPLARALADWLAPGIRPDEQPAYREHLVYGGPADPTAGRQRHLAKLLARFPDEAMSPDLMRKLAAVAAREDAGLADRLEAIRCCESVLAPAASVFSWLARNRNRTRAELVHDLRESFGDRWPVEAAGFADRREELQACAPEAAALWLGVSEAMAAGDQGAVIDHLVALNAQVMQARGASPWLEFRGDRLAVHIRDEWSQLPTAADLPHLWRHSYFVDALRTVIALCAMLP